MRRRLCTLVGTLILSACAPAAGAPSPASITRSSPGPTSTATANASPAGADQDSMPGPAGMTLRQEIGAVMMVGFKGPATPAVLADWRQRQYGGLILVPINQNAGTPAAIHQLIESVRAVGTHTLLVSTDQEGGTVCFRATQVPCLAGAREAGPLGPTAIEAEMKTMSAGLKALGFDINFAPVADVWDGIHPFMSDRSYGQDPQRVAQDVTGAIAGIHAAGMYAAAKHFPGHGTANADSHQSLPLVSESLATLRARDWLPFQAAIGAQVDFVMVGHLSVPALDGLAPTSMSASVLQALRQDLGYRGVVISDDMQMGALSPQFPPPTAAVRFLKNGGDMVIVSHDLAVADATDEAIHAAVLDGSYPRAQLDASVQKLLTLTLKFMP
jgi:beta-N-acetylhexosaminidase